MPNCARTQQHTAPCVYSALPKINIMSPQMSTFEKRLLKARHKGRSFGNASGSPSPILSTPTTAPPPHPPLTHPLKSLVNPSPPPRLTIDPLRRHNAASPSASTQALVRVDQLDWGRGKKKKRSRALKTGPKQKPNGGFSLGRFCPVDSLLRYSFPGCGLETLV